MWNRKDKSRDAADEDVNPQEGRPIDLVVHPRNKKGDVVNAKPYRLVIENGQQMFEVPPGSGDFFSQNGDRIQKENRRMSNQKDQSQGFDSKAPMSQPANPPDKDMLGEVKEKEEPQKVKDDHVQPEKAQQEFQAQQGKATSRDTFQPTRK